MRKAWTSENWIAVERYGPGRKEYEIYVRGECSFPSPGWRAKLATGLSITHRLDTLYLRLYVAGPRQVDSETVTRETVTFEDHGARRYRWVEINDGDVVRVEVSRVDAHSPPES